MKLAFLLVALAVFTKADPYAWPHDELCISMPTPSGPVFSWSTGTSITCNFAADSSYEEVVSLTLPELVTADHLRFEGNMSMVVEIYLPVLNSTTGYHLAFNGLPSLKYIDLPVLTYTHWPLWIRELASFDGGLNAPVVADTGGIWFHEWGAALPPCHIQQDIYLPNLVNTQRVETEEDSQGLAVYLMLPFPHTVMYFPNVVAPAPNMRFPSGELFHILDFDCPAPPIWAGNHWIANWALYSEKGFESCETNKGAFDWCSRGYCSCEQRDVGTSHCLCPTTPHWINNDLWRNEWIADRNITLA